MLVATDQGVACQPITSVACPVRLSDSLGLLQRAAAFHHPRGSTKKVRSPKWPQFHGPASLYVRGGEAWELAAREAKLDPSAVSSFGQAVMKYPASMVKEVMSFNHAKMHKYNFIGSAFA